MEAHLSNYQYEATVEATKNETEVDLPGQDDELDNNDLAAAGTTAAEVVRFPLNIKVGEAASEF